MILQEIFRASYVETLRRNAAEGTTVDFYKSDSFEYDREQVLFSPEIRVQREFKLQLPEGSRFFDAENAVSLYSAYRDLTPLQASDTRLWTYLAHVDLYPYMCARWDAVKTGRAKDASKYIIAHWFVGTPSQSNLLRHGLAGLWWAAFLSHDPEREDQFELTKILFTQLDFATRTLGTYKLARYKPAVLGILEFIAENEDLFSEHFESKQRFVTRYLNQVGGVKPMPYFAKDFFKSELELVRDRIALM